MNILNFKQGSDEWRATRIGIPSASQFKNIVTSSGKLSTSRTKYLYALAGERITGIREEIYQNYAMTRGIELEGEAREEFIFSTGIEVKEVGCCIHESGLYLCSPDGLIGEESGIEIKCPGMATHIEYLLGKRVPPDYYQQVHGSMLVTGFNEWFFVSYYPGLPSFIHLEKRNEEFCEKLEKELVEFCSDLDKIVMEIKK
jgi:hypothetical protein